MSLKVGWAVDFEAEKTFLDHVTRQKPLPPLPTPFGALFTDLSSPSSTLLFSSEFGIFSDLPKVSVEGELCSGVTKRKVKVNNTWHYC